MNLVVSEKGSGFRSVPFVVKIFNVVYGCLTNGTKDPTQIRDALHEEGLKFLKPLSPTAKGRGAFSSAAKTAAIITSALENATRCGECGSRVHYERAITVDHHVRKGDGGSSHSDNALLMHPFCNSGVKEQRIAKELK